MKQAPWLLKHDQLTLNCHVQPGAKRTGLNGLHNDRLKIQLSAPPVDGKANKSLIEYLSKLCARPRSNVMIYQGKSSPFKTVKIEGMKAVPQQLISLLEE